MFALTEDLLDRFHGSLQHLPAPSGGADERLARDNGSIADDLLADARADEPLLVFAYGSLLWKPAFRPEFEAPAVAAGWHRAFRLTLTDWRGTPDNPGLMMALDRGGTCHGVAMAMADKTRRADLLELLRREVCPSVPPNRPKWISIRVRGRATRAICFCADRTAPGYAGALSEAEVVETLSRAFGHFGSCAEYLQKTNKALAGRGLRDRKLRRLETLVAARISARLIEERTE